MSPERHATKYMIKISIFVEGQTERIFIERLLIEYLTSTKLLTASYQLIRNQQAILKLERGNKGNPEIFILIYDVGGCDNVIPTLLDWADNMINRNDFKKLLAVRDLYPVPIKDKEKLISDIKNQFNRFEFSDKLKLILAIREIEAWFLADHDLFSKIDSRLKPAFIKDKIGIDLDADDPEDYEHPSKIIDDILKLINQRYAKKEKDTYRIIDRIDYTHLCVGLSHKVSSFFQFLEAIDECVLEYGMK